MTTRKSDSGIPLSKSDSGIPLSKSDSGIPLSKRDSSSLTSQLSVIVVAHSVISVISGSPLSKI